MTTNAEVSKSMISGGNAEGLKSEATATAPASDLSAMYPSTAEGQAAAKATEDKAVADKAASDKAVSDKAAADKAEADKKAAEPTPEQKAAADKVTADKAAADKAATDKAEADKAAADKAEADKVAAMTPEEKAAYEKEKADKAEADKKAAEEAAKKKEPVDLSKMALPDGLTKIDPAILADMTKIANEHGLDVKTAEALVPLGQKVAQNTVDTINKGYNEIRAGWRDEVINDPAIGTKEQMAIADRGLTAYGSPGLRKMLDESGLGDHPEFIRMCHKIGKTVSEDVIERGGSGDTHKIDAASVMYPSMKK